MQVKGMKHILWILSVAFLLGSCAPASTPAPEPTPTLSPPTPTPAKLAPPPLQVGATYPYPDGATLLAVPAGSFIMGAIKGSDNPQHQVTLNGFWIYSTKVTNGQYQLC